MARNTSLRGPSGGLQGGDDFTTEELNRPHGRLMRHLTGLCLQQQCPNTEALFDVAQLPNHRVRAAHDQVVGILELLIGELIERPGSALAGHQRRNPRDIAWWRPILLWAA